LAQAVGSWSGHRPLPIKSPAMASSTAAEEAVVASPSKFTLSASAPAAETATAEETVPALGARASSRDAILVASGEGRGNKGLMLAVLGGIVLLAVGAGVAATTLGQQKQQQPSSQVSRSEFLHGKPEVSKDGHEGSGNSTGANKTSIHHAMLNASLNSTSNHSTNASHPKTKHDHLKCSGGAVAACQCLMACKVFGAQPSQCAGKKAHLLDSLIQKALSSPADACRGMQCIVRCARTLQCYDDRVQSDCRALASHFPPVVSSDSGEDDSTCRYECDADDDDAHMVNALVK